MIYLGWLAVYALGVILALFVLLLADKYRGTVVTESGINQLSKAGLNSWERLCLDCRRIYPKLRRLMPLFLVVLAAVWGVTAILGCIYTIRNFSMDVVIHPDVWPNPLPPFMDETMVLSFWGLTVVILAYLMVCRVIHALALVETDRLEVDWS